MMVVSNHSILFLLIIMPRIYAKKGILIDLPRHSKNKYILVLATSALLICLIIKIIIGLVEGT